MKIDACLSHTSDHWATPEYIYRQVTELGMFDPCPLHSERDGLIGDWGKTNFVNPPYSELKRWVAKSIEQAKLGKRVVLLIPARTDTQAFKMLFAYGAHITFITGRLRFNEADCAPFPSMLVDLCGGV